MKKLVLLLIVVCSLSILTGCQKKSGYDDLEIDEISFINTINSTQMSVKKTINLKEKTYKRTVYNDLDIEIDSLEVNLEDRFIERFRLQIVRAGLFSISEENLDYYDNFGQWEITSLFKTGEKFHFTAYNRLPKNAKRVDNVVYQLTGDTFFNSLDSAIFNPPLLGVELSSTVDNYEYVSSSYIHPINYKWNKEEELDNDILELFNEGKIKTFNHLPLLKMKFTNRVGYSNTCLSFTISQYDFENKEFVVITNGSNIYGSKILCNDGTLYKVDVTFDAGLVEYAFYIDK